MKHSVTFLTLAIATASFADTTIYSTGFESPFTVGSIETQQSWNVDADVPFNIQNTNVFAGSQAVTFDTGPAGVVGWSWVDFAPAYNPTTTTEKKVLASAKVYIASDPAHPTLFSWGGLDAYAGTPAFGRLAAIEFSGSGATRMIGSTIQNSTVTTTLDAWHTVEMTLDFVTSTATGKIDGIDLGVTIPFTGTNMTDVDLIAVPSGYNLISFDDYSVKSLSSGLTVAGTLTLGDFAGTTNQAFTAVIKNGSTVVDTQNISVAPNGAYSFATTASAGNYDIIFQGVTWLGKKVSGVNLTTGTNSVNASLLNGDAVLDNAVDLSDYTAVVTAFNATPSAANWNARADLNQDLVVDLTDYTIIAVNFNAIGN